MPSPLQRGATPATPTDRQMRFSGGGSGGIFGAGLRACFHRTRLANRSDVPLLVSVFADDFEF